MNEELITALKTDEGCREGWRANIAMAIYDTQQGCRETAHDWRNRCAETFLNRLCGQPEGLEDLPGMFGLAASVAQPENPDG